MPLQVEYEGRWARNRDVFSLLAHAAMYKGERERESKKYDTAS